MRSPTNEPLCLLEMRRIDHLAVEGEYARSRVFGEDRHNRAGTRQFGIGWHKRGVDRFDLRWMDRQHAGEAIARGAHGETRQTLQILEVRIYGFDGQYARSVCAEQS